MHHRCSPPAQGTEGTVPSNKSYLRWQVTRSRLRKWRNSSLILVRFCRLAPPSRKPLAWKWLSQILHASVWGCLFVCFPFVVSGPWLLWVPTPPSDQEGEGPRRRMMEASRPGDGRRTEKIWKDGEIDRLGSYFRPLSCFLCFFLGFLGVVLLVHSLRVMGGRPVVEGCQWHDGPTAPPSLKAANRLTLSAQVSPKEASFEKIALGFENLGWKVTAMVL